MMDLAATDPNLTPNALRKRGMSRATTGKSLFAQGGDGRGPWARRLRDLLRLHINDLGGAGTASEAERSIIRGAQGITKKAMSFAERNVLSTFEFAQQIVQAKDIQELIRMQSRF
jgi:Phasin protein